MVVAAKDQAVFYDANFYDYVADYLVGDALSLSFAPCFPLPLPLPLPLSLARELWQIAAAIYHRPLLGGLRRSNKQQQNCPF